MDILKDDDRLEEVTAENFAAFTGQTGRPVLVCFFARGDRASRMIRPELETAAQEMPRARFGLLDVEEYPELAEKSRIMAVPTTIAYRDGKRIARSSGVVLSSTLLALARKCGDAEDNGGAKAAADTAAKIPAAEEDRIVSLTEETFPDFIARGDQTVLVCFFAHGDRACRMIRPELEDAAEAVPGTKIGLADVEEFPHLAEENRIFAVPTTIAFRDGKRLKRATGAVLRDTIKALAQH